MYPKLKKLYAKNRKAASGMVIEIVRGVHAGNENMTPQAAAKIAMATAEEIMVTLEPSPQRSVTATGEDD